MNESGRGYESVGVSFLVSAEDFNKRLVGVVSRPSSPSMKSFDSDEEGVVSVSLETRSLSLCRSGEESGDEWAEFRSPTRLSSSKDAPLTFSPSLSSLSFSMGRGGERIGGGSWSFEEEEEEEEKERRRACSL